MGKIQAWLWILPFFALLCWILQIYIGIEAEISKDFEADMIRYSLRSSVLMALYLFFRYYYSMARQEHGQRLRSLFYLVIIVASISVAANTFLRLSEDILHWKLVGIQFAIFEVDMVLWSVYITATMASIRYLASGKKQRLPWRWGVFEFVLFSALVLSKFDYLWNAFEYILIEGFIGLVIILWLAFDQRWVAYLNKTRKWEATYSLLAVILVLAYFLQLNIGFDYSIDKLLINPLSGPFALFIYVFIIIYATVSLLILLFNLPIADVLDERLAQGDSLRTLSAYIQGSTKEQELYDVLLDQAMDVAQAQAAWLEVLDEEGKIKSYISRNITTSNGIKLKSFLALNEGNIKQRSVLLKELDKEEGFKEIKKLGYKSMYFSALQTYQKVRVGELVLWSNDKDGISIDASSIINSLTGQVAVAIENFRYEEKTESNKRYEQELIVAKKARKKLLPVRTLVDDRIEMRVLANTAGDIGGDYYDYHYSERNKLVIMIGDVSGKGTSAAFYMAQLKGIFHGLIPLNLSPSQFMYYANDAAGRCLDRSSFITALLASIDFEKQEITLARAGHSPPLYYSKEIGAAEYLSINGIGLGIVRDTTSFQKFTKYSKLPFKSGDMLILSTDGITESKNENGEDYGFTRLQELVNANANSDVKDICRLVDEDLQTFTKGKVDDDYTLIVMRFVG